VADIYRRGGVQLQLAAVVQAQAAVLTGGGALVGHQRRQRCGTPSQCSRATRREQQRQHFEHLAALGAGAAHGWARATGANALNAFL